MCVFSKPIEEIGNTRILVAPVGAIHTACTSYSHGGGPGKQESLSYYTATRQLTVYSNDVMLTGGKLTAMILPFPVSAETRAADPGGCGLRVHVMSASTGSLFAALEKAAYKMVGGARQRGFVQQKPPLDVHKAGAYKYSVVPTVDDFVRVDNDVFGFTAGSELHELLKGHYDGGFAFLTCIIESSAKMHPFAYEHDMLPDGRIFVPTRHYHPQTFAVAPTTSVMNSLASRSALPRPPLPGRDAYPDVPATITGKRLRSDFKAGLAGPVEGEGLEEEDADWDHKIFSIGCDINAGGWYSDHPLNAREISCTLRRDAITRLPFPLPDTSGMILRMNILSGTGAHPNEDIILQLESGLA